MRRARTTGAAIEALLATATASLDAQADAARDVCAVLFFETSNQLCRASPR